MIKIIKEFLEFKRAETVYEKIELTQKDKAILETLDKETLDKILLLTYNNLAKDLLKEKYEREYVLWYKHSIQHIRSYFRKYINK